MKKIIGIIVVLIGLLLIVGCTGPQIPQQAPPANAPAPPTEPVVKQETTTAPTQPSEPAVAKQETTNTELLQVVVENFKFAPVSLEIKVGDSVEWINKDSVRHTVNIPSLNIDLNLPAGATVTQKFSEKGSFDYHCTPHPSMQAKVIVN